MSLLLDPRLTRCRRVFLHGLCLNVSIGFHDFERQAPQRVLIDVELFVADDPQRDLRDDVAEVLDYDEVRNAVSALARSRHFNLQETLLGEIVQIGLRHPSVVAVLASTQKPDVYPDSRTVGIEILRFRSTL